MGLLTMKRNFNTGVEEMEPNLLNWEWVTLIVGLWWGLIVAACFGSSAKTVISICDLFKKGKLGP